MVVRLAREAYQKGVTRTTPRMLTHLPQAQGEPVESYFVHIIVPTHDANGKVSGVIIYAVDQTTQRAEEIEEERERLRLIFDNTNATALALYDAQTAELIMGSPRYLDLVARMHGFDRNELIGHKWYELSFFASGEEAMTLWNTVLESRAPVRLAEVRYHFAPDEQETVWDWSITPILDTAQSDTARFMLVSMTEITEQVLARQEMEQSRG